MADFDEKSAQVPLRAASSLEGTLSLPQPRENARGLVLFAHGSGSSQFSSRNRYVASVLQSAGLATLLFDLLTPSEEALDLRTGELRFNIALLAERLLGAVDWARENEETRHLKIGCFGSSTGGGAALMAAAQRPEEIRAVVSRGGRPDLADAFLADVMAPTLLIVGGNDDAVLKLNRGAMRQFRVETQLHIVPRATHLFEEPGALEEVAQAAAKWFVRHLGGNPGAKKPL